MDSEKIERLRERMLQCSVCMDEYRDPRILPCHHTLCFDCIVNVVHSSSASGRLFKCPQCRSDVFVPQGGIDDLPINFYITSLQDELGSKGYTAPCSTCERHWLIAQFRCMDCDIDICRFCIHGHRLQTHRDIPKIIRIETSTSSIQQASITTCSEHADELMQMFCTKCNKAICITCSVSSHKQHSIVPLSTKLKESKSFLQLQVDTLTSEKRKATKAADYLRQTKDEAVITFNRSRYVLEAVYERAREMIRKKKIEIELELLNSKDKQIKSIDKALNDYTVYTKEIDRGLAFLLDLQDVDMCYEVIDTYKEFSHQLDTLRRGFTSNHIRVDQKKYSPFGFSHIYSFNFGITQKFYHFGNLGSLYAKRFCLSIHPKTLEIKKHHQGISLIIGSWPVKYLAQFLLAFLFWQFFFLLCDSIGIFSLVAGFMTATYTLICESYSACSTICSKWVV